MANTIVLKRSAVPGKVPATTDLSLGEIAVNTYDGKLYIKRNAGSDSIVEMMRADFTNANSLGTGILCGGGGSPQYRSIASGDSAITVTNANGTSGNPTVTFQPGSVAIGNLAGTLALNKGGTGATTQNAAANAILPAQSTNSGKFLTTNGTDSSWATVSASPAGSTGQIQYNSAGAFGAAGGIKINSAGDFEFVQSASPVVPSNNNNLVVYKSNSAYPTLAVKHPDLGIGNAADDLLQAQFGSKDIGWWNPPGNATTVPGVLGITAPTVNGTATTRTTASTTAVTRTRRVGYVTAATVNTQCGQSWTARQWTYGNGSGLGGFYMIYRFAVSDVSLISTGRWMFVGMTTQSGPLSALPTTACFGLVQLTGGTNYFMRVAGGTLGTDVDLGANFPVDLTSVYEVRLFSSPNDTTVVKYEVIRLNTGDTAVGSFSTTGLSFNSGTLMAPQAIRSTGATQATAVGLDIMSLYIEKTF